MPSYILKGTRVELSQAVGGVSAFDALNSDKSTAQIGIDYSRTHFIGKPAEADRHLSGWNQKAEELAPTYNQGDMFAEIDRLQYADPQTALILFPTDNDYPEYRIKKECFAFVDERGVLSSIGIAYDPEYKDRWFISITKDTTRLPHERVITYISSFKPDEEPTTFFYRKIIKPDCDLKEFDTSKAMQLATAINHPLIATYISLILHDIRNADIMSLLFFSPVRVNGFLPDYSQVIEKLSSNDELSAFLNNPVLRLVKDLDITLSPAQLMACLDSNSAIYQFLNGLKDNQDAKTDLAVFAKMYCKFDAWGISEKFDTIKHDTDFLRKLNSQEQTAESQNFLKSALSDDKKFQVIQFIAKSDSDNFNQLLGELKKNNGDDIIWDRLYTLSQAKFKEEDRLIHNTLCHMVINDTQQSVDEIVKKAGFIGTLTSLSSHIHPGKLARLLQSDEDMPLYRLLAQSMKLSQDNNTNVVNNSPAVKARHEAFEGVFKYILEDVSLTKDKQFELIGLTKQIIISPATISKLDSATYSELYVRVQAISKLADLSIAPPFAEVVMGKSLVSDTLRALLDKVDLQCKEKLNSNSYSEKVTYRKEMYGALITFLNSSKDVSQADELQSAIKNAESKFPVGDFDDIRESVSGLLLAVIEENNPRIRDLGKFLNNFPNEVLDKLNRLEFSKKLLTIDDEEQPNKGWLIANSLTFSPPEEQKLEKSAKLEAIFNHILNSSEIENEHRNALLVAAYESVNTGNIAPLQSALGNGHNKLLDSVRVIHQIKNIETSQSLLNAILDNSLQGSAVRTVIKHVESKCSEMKERLGANDPKLDALNIAEPKYREAVYKAVLKYTTSLKKPDSEDFENSNPVAFAKLKQEMLEAENNLLAVTKEDKRPVVRYFAMVITNLVTMIFTAGLANIAHWRKTGDKLFFGSNETSKRAKELTIDLLDDLSDLSSTSIPKK